MQMLMLPWQNWPYNAAIRIAPPPCARQDAAGIIHFEGDHNVHVLKITHDTLTEDTRFKLDFNTAFKTGPARPHGIAMK